MWNLLKTIKGSQTKVLEEPKKTTKELIEEIHESFYTEVDKLLAYAKISKSLESDKKDLIKKRKRLIALGFENTKEVEEADKELDRLYAIKEENRKKHQLATVIEYFSVKYPTYKFITEESVKKICGKYGLVYGEVSRYRGTVPAENLAHIEQFKLNPEDELWEQRRTLELWRGRDTLLGFNYHSGRVKDKYLKEKETLEAVSYDHRRYPTYSRSDKSIDIDDDSITITVDHDEHTVITKASLEIAAPKSDFDLKGMEVKDFKLVEKQEIPDPVVLAPVFHNGNKYYLIVTAWGEEASDELVLNEKLN